MFQPKMHARFDSWARETGIFRLGASDANLATGVLRHMLNSTPTVLQSTEIFRRKKRRLIMAGSCYRQRSRELIRRR
jgi:hypothetical protein